MGTVQQSRHVWDGSRIPASTAEGEVTLFRLLWSATLLLVSLAAGLAAIAGPVYLSWTWARAAQPLRLRWVMVAKQDLPPGTRITAEHLRGELVRVPDPGREPNRSPSRPRDVVTRPDAVVGKYARQAIPDRAVLTRELVSEFVPTGSDAGFMVVPVESKSEYVGSLRPGSRVAFAKAGKLFPPTNSLRPAPSAAGFLLLALTPSRDGATTTLTVLAPRPHFEWVTALADGQWRPVLIAP